MKLKSGLVGLDGLNAALAGIGGGEALSEALAETADEIRRRAAASLSDGAPPDSRTGALAESLAVTRDADGGYIVGTGLDYGWHLEFGTSRRPPAPWLATAAADAEPALRDRASESLNGGIANAVRRSR